MRKKSKFCNTKSNYKKKVKILSLKLVDKKITWQFLETKLKFSVKRTKFWTKSQMFLDKNVHFGKEKSQNSWIKSRNSESQSQT